MLAFPSMLVGAAEKAGMKVPADAKDYDVEEYPHFYVFCTVQLGRAMAPGEHWENAKVIAEIPDDQIRKVTVLDLIGMGLSIRT